MGDRVVAAGDGGEAVAENVKKDRLAEMAKMMEWAAKRRKKKEATNDCSSIGGGGSGGASLRPAWRTRHC